MKILDDKSFITVENSSYTEGEYKLLLKKVLPQSEAYISFCGSLFYQFNFDNSDFSIPPAKEDRESATKDFGSVIFKKYSIFI